MSKGNIKQPYTVKCLECDSLIPYKDEKVYAFTDNATDPVTRNGVKVKSVYLTCPHNHTNMYYVPVE